MRSTFGLVVAPRTAVGFAEGVAIGGAGVVVAIGSAGVVVADADGWMDEGGLGLGRVAGPTDLVGTTLVSAATGADDGDPVLAAPTASAAPPATIASSAAAARGRYATSGVPSGRRPRQLRQKPETGVLTSPHSGQVTGRRDFATAAHGCTWRARPAERPIPRARSRPRTPR